MKNDWVIYKYDFPLQDVVDLLLPVGSKILKIEPQNNKPKYWLLRPVDDTNSRVEVRRFRVYGTGHYIEDIERLTHITSFQDGDFIWHIFEDIDYHRS